MGDAQITQLYHGGLCAVTSQHIIRNVELRLGFQSFPYPAFGACSLCFGRRTRNEMLTDLGTSEILSTVRYSKSDLDPNSFLGLGWSGKSSKNSFDSRIAYGPSAQRPCPRRFICSENPVFGVTNNPIPSRSRVENNTNLEVGKLLGLQPHPVHTELSIHSVVIRLRLRLARFT